MTEAELCDLLAVAATRSGLWEVYPEVDGWDLLLVLTRDYYGALYRGAPRAVGNARPAGYQIGVEAKLRASAAVLYEALVRSERHHRPDECAVLVPRAGRAFVSLAGRLELRVFNAQPPNPWPAYDGESIVPSRTATTREPAQRLELPAVALVGSGGQPSPRTMSAWRVGALRLLLRLEERGELWSADFAELRVDKSRWIRARWLVSAGRVGRATRYVTGPRMALNGPAVGYEAELAALRAAPSTPPAAASGVAR